MCIGLRCIAALELREYNINYGKYECNSQRVPRNACQVILGVQRQKAMNCKFYKHSEPTSYHIHNTVTVKISETNMTGNLQPMSLTISYKQVYRSIVKKTQTLVQLRIPRIFIHFMTSWFEYRTYSRHDPQVQTRKKESAQTVASATPQQQDSVQTLAHRTLNREIKVNRNAKMFQRNRSQ